MTITPDDAIEPTGIIEPEVGFTHAHWDAPWQIDYPDKRIRAVMIQEDNVLGYEWETFVVLVNTETGRLHWYEFGGCSCDHLGSKNAPLSEFTTGDRDQLLVDFGAWAGNSLDDETRHTARAELVNQIRKVRP